jgi:hypothetical protein
MTILAIIKGRGQEAIDACKSRSIEGKAIRVDIFGATHIEVNDSFKPQLDAWFNEETFKRTGKAGTGGYPIGTLLFFTKSKTGE